MPIVSTDKICKIFLPWPLSVSLLAAVQYNFGSGGQMIQ